MATILKNLKGIDLSCVSPASTAICSSTTDPHNPSTIRHRHSTSSNHYSHHGPPPTTPRPLHRLNTYLQDQYRHLPPTTPKCISDQLLPITPRALRKYTTQQKPVFSSSSSTTAAANSTPVIIRRKSSADISDILAMRRKSTSSITTPRGRRCSSSRYYLLLRDDNENDNKPNKFEKDADAAAAASDNPLAIIPCEPIVTTGLTRSGGGDSDVYFDRSSALVVSQPLVKSSKFSQKEEDSTATTPRMRLKDEKRMVVNSSSSQTSIGKNQVVVLKVSLHCKGCEGKLKKHLSKMQGVRSFSIDLEMKKVTVTLEGNMTPADLLANISRVKYAEFWTSSPSSTSTSWSSVSPSSSSSTTSSKFNYA